MGQMDGRACGQNKTKTIKHRKMYLKKRCDDNDDENESFVSAIKTNGSVIVKFSGLFIKAFNKQQQAVFV